MQAVLGAAVRWGWGSRTLHSSGPSEGGLGVLQDLAPAGTVAGCSPRSGRDDKGIFVAPMLPTAQSRAVSPACCPIWWIPGASATTCEGAAQTGLGPPSPNVKVLHLELNKR